MKRTGNDRIDDLAAKAFERRVEAVVMPGKTESVPTYRLEPGSARQIAARQKAPRQKAAGQGAAFALAAAMFAIIVLSPVAIARGRGGFARYAQRLTDSAEIADMSRNLGNSLGYLRQ